MVAYTSPPRTSPGLDRLRDPRAPSGYHGVERHKRAWRWREPFTKRPMSSHRDPRAAALALLAWWEGQYGDAWPRVFAARCDNPAKALKRRPRRGDPARVRAWDGRAGVETAGGYKLVVWLSGVPTVLYPPGGHVWFATAAAARRHYKAWLKARYGLFLPLAPLEVRQARGPVPPPPWVRRDRP